MQNDTPPDGSASSRGLAKRMALLVVVVAAAGFAFTQFRDVLTLDYLAQQESRLRGLQTEHPLLSYGAAFLIYVVVTGLSLPGAAVLTLTYGWFFGLLPGILLVSFASTAGATVAMLMSRYLFRDAVQRRFGDRLAKFNDALERYGAYFLFTLRLVVALPFFIINLVMGLTPIRVWTFWWVSQLGMLPATAVYVFAGSSVPSLEALASEGVGAVFSARQMFQLAIAFGLLGLFPWLVRVTLTFFGFAAPSVAGDSLPAGNDS